MKRKQFVSCNVAIRIFIFAAITILSFPLPLRAQRTPTIALVTTSGVVPMGARKLTFIFSSNFAGTILGVAFSGATDAALTIEPPMGDLLKSVSYTITAGSMRIVEVQ